MLKEMLLLSALLGSTVSSLGIRQSISSATTSSIPSFVKKDSGLDYSRTFMAPSSSMLSSSGSSNLSLVHYHVSTKALDSSISIPFSEELSLHTEKKCVVGSDGLFTFSINESNKSSTPKSIKNNLQTPDIRYQKTAPLNAVCKTQAQHAGKELWAVGSGFFVLDDIIMSAAHCFFENNDFYEDPKIFCQQNDSSTPTTFQYMYQITDIYMPARFYLSGNTDGALSARSDDWCFARVNREEGNNPQGYLSIASHYTLANIYSYAIGFPVDEPIATKTKGWLSYSCGYETLEPDSTSLTTLYNLTNYIVGGMSGGPLYFENENEMTFETYQGVAGIITRSSTSDHHGYAVKINNAMIKTLEEIQK